MMNVSISLAISRHVVSPLCVVVDIVRVHGALPLLAGGDEWSQNGNQSDEGMIFERSSKAINRYGVHQDLGPCKFATRLAHCLVAHQVSCVPEFDQQPPIIGHPLCILIPNHRI